MATPEPLGASRRLSQAALAERERLGRQLEKLDARGANLREQLRGLDRDREDILKRLALLDELLPGAPARHLQPVESKSEEAPPRGYLRGAAIRRVAVQLLAAGERAEAAIHYTRWLELVQEAGYGIAGRDPGATFLTQISRSALVVRGDAPGLYMLDLEASTGLQKHLEVLHAELLALHQGQQTLEAIVSTRERREELVGEIARTERKLEEALATLGEGDPGRAERSQSLPL